jgi:ankyrin repeat protein
MANNTEKTLVNAICNGNLEYIKTINPSKLNTVMKNGYSPLALAVSEAQDEIIEFLLAKGVTRNVRPEE